MNTFDENFKLSSHKLQGFTLLKLQNYALFYTKPCNLYNKA